MHTSNKIIFFLLLSVVFAHCSDKTQTEFTSQTALNATNKEQIRQMFNLNLSSLNTFLSMNVNTPGDILERMAHSDDEVASTNARNNPSYLDYVKVYSDINYVPAKVKYDNDKVSKITAMIKENDDEVDLETQSKNTAEIFKIIQDELPFFIEYNNALINRYIVRLNLAPKVFIMLYQNNLKLKDFKTFENMANNLDTPNSVLNILAKDNNLFIRHLAKSTLQKKSSEDEPSSSTNFDGF